MGYDIYPTLPGIELDNLFRPKRAPIPLGHSDGHCFKLFKRRYRLDVGRFKFASRVCDEWNRLDEDIVESVNGFKRKLDHHLRNVRGYF